jgi:hypothetical protein
MKDLIVKSFKEILNLDVRVLNPSEDDIDMAIYVVRDKKIRKMSEKELEKYSFDYAVTRVNSHDNSLWVYMRAYSIDAKYSRNGEFVSPPEIDYQESMMTFKTAELALRELIIEEIKDKFKDLLLWQEEENMRKGYK